MQTLILKDMPGWHYIDLIYDKHWHAIAAAHILNEGRSGPYPIIDALPTRHLDALDAITALLPERLTVVSDEKVLAKVRGTIPPGVIGCRPFAAIPEHMTAISDFHGQVAVTQQCLQCAQLLGWLSTPGEEWHDMVLAEFGWEYLS